MINFNDSFLRNVTIVSLSKKSAPSWYIACHFFLFFFRFCCRFLCIDNSYQDHDSSRNHHADSHIFDVNRGSNKTETMLFIWSNFMSLESLL